MIADFLQNVGILALKFQKNWHSFLKETGFSIGSLKEKDKILIKMLISCRFLLNKQKKPLELAVLNSNFFWFESKKIEGF